MEMEMKIKPAIPRNRLVIIVLIIAVLAAAGLMYWNAVRTTVSTDNAKVTGDLVDVSPKVAGQLQALYVVQGQDVKQGQVLAKLDDSQYKINLQQAQAALDLARANYARLPDDIKSANSTVEKSVSGIAAAEAQYKSAQIQLADAQRQLDHNQSLYASGAISKETLDTIQSNYNKAQAALEAAAATVKTNQQILADAQAKLNSSNNTQAAIYKAQLDQAQAAYNNAKLALDNTTITAVISGTILRIPEVVGENLTAGQTILTISNLNGTWVTANIEEKYYYRIKLGQKVDVSIDAYPGRTFSGIVSETGNATQATFSLISTENASGNYTKVAQRLPVKIKVHDPGKALKPGMSAVVKIHTK